LYLKNEDKENLESRDRNRHSNDYQDHDKDDFIFHSMNDSKSINIDEVITFSS